MPATPQGIRSLGALPAASVVEDALREATSESRGADGGAVATYIPALRTAGLSVFAIAYADPRGVVTTSGDADALFTLQSVSKPFIYAAVCRSLGAESAAALIGENSTGMPFDIVHRARTNPMVNAGALIASSLLPGATAAAKSATAVEELSRFAGRSLGVNEDVFRSEMLSNERNRLIADELADAGLIDCPPDVAFETYTRHCAVEVTVSDLAPMGATLAAGGENPATNVSVVGADVCRRVLAVMATAGLYEGSGEWLADTGLLSKSGVSGALLSVAPGRGALAAYSPRIDGAGTSVRGAIATRLVASRLRLGLFDGGLDPSRR